MPPAARLLLAAVMISAGVLHFRTPRPFIRIVPPWLPAPAVLVAVSGVFEILGGVGLLVPATQQLAAWGLIALFVAVFPANVHMARARIPLGRRAMPTWMLWARLPLQGVLIAWAWWFT